MEEKKIRCKFTCLSVVKTPHGTEEVEFMPVTPTADRPENEKFWQATPTGSARLGIDNPAAQDQFQVGHSYYFDITEAQ